MFVSNMAVDETVLGGTFVALEKARLIAQDVVKPPSASWRTESTLR
jgi:hypothetical protein